MARATRRDGKLVEGAIVRGDQFAVSRRVAIDPGAVIVSATLRVGPARGSPALFTKTITATPGADGYISEDGSAYPGLAELQFVLSSANTLAMTAGTRYEYDMRYTTADGAVYTWETGTVIVIDRIT